MGGRGNSGERNTVKSAPWSYVYMAYRNQIESASELSINPDNGHAVFEKGEAAVTPVIEDFLKNQTGTDEQLRKFYEKEFPKQRINITRSKYL